jgi:cytochrome c553
MKRFLNIAAGAVLATLAAGAVARTAAAADLAEGQKRYNVNCVNCHGNAGQGMASFPAIRGREAAYIVEKLETYRAREMVGPNSAIMMSLSSDLTDADIANLAAFIADRFQ